MAIVMKSVTVWAVPIGVDVGAAIVPIAIGEVAIPEMTPTVKPAVLTVSRTVNAVMSTVNPAMIAAMSIVKPVVPAVRVAVPVPGHGRAADERETEGQRNHGGAEDVCASARVPHKCLLCESRFRAGHWRFSGRV